MAGRRIQTYADIVDAIREAVGIQAADTNAINKIKRLVNMYYLDEVVPFKRWTWLQKQTQVVHKAYHNVGTVIVTPTSTAITFNTAPNVSLGSFKGHRFSIDGSNKVYTIASHSAGSASATLTSAYQEDIDATANYKLWRDRIDLPTNAKETVEITHAESPKPLDAVGPQTLRKLEASNPKGEGFPRSYNTGDFFDPSDTDDELESDRYRQTRIFPAITPTPVTLDIDYVEEPVELEDDADEPLIPIGDRIVLYYGAGAEAWSILSRNEEMADKWRIKAQQKLVRMAGERDDGYDQPTLAPRTGYINGIRKAGLRRRSISGFGGGGQSSVALPSYLQNVTIDGATIRQDVTVSDGVLIDGRDLSEDGIIIDSIGSTIDLTLLDNTSNGVAATFLLTDYDVVHLQYSVKHGASALEAGAITLAGNGATASIAQGPVVDIGDSGTTFTTDISGGALRLLYTTTSTGTDRTMKYRAFKWLG